MLGLDSARFSNGLRKANQDTRHFVRQQKAAVRGLAFGPNAMGTGRGGIGGMMPGMGIGVGGGIGIGKLFGAFAGFSALGGIKRQASMLAELGETSLTGGSVSEALAKKGLFPSKDEIARLTQAGEAMATMRREYSNLALKVVSSKPVSQAFQAPLNIWEAAGAAMRQMFGSPVTTMGGQTSFAKQDRADQLRIFEDLRRNSDEAIAATTAESAQLQRNRSRFSAAIGDPKYNAGDRDFFQRRIAEIDAAMQEAGRRRAQAVGDRARAEMNIESIGELALQPVLERKLAEAQKRLEDEGKQNQSGSFGFGSADSLRFMPKGGAGAFVNGNRKVDLMEQHLSSIKDDISRLTDELTASRERGMTN